MLKWTLRTPGDSYSCPTFGSLGGLGETVFGQSEVKFDLEDSNKCWYETRIKMAQVKSTCKVTHANAKENGNEMFIENGFENGKNNKFISHKIPSLCDDEEKIRKHHKPMKCSVLDPLKFFSGEVTDSETGSVYMTLDKTPAALEQKKQNSFTNRFDPRRRPLIDISNGDYSDLRKHLQLREIPIQYLSHAISPNRTTSENQFSSQNKPISSVPNFHLLNSSKLNNSLDISPSRHHNLHTESFINSSPHHYNANHSRTSSFPLSLQRGIVDSNFCDIKSKSSKHKNNNIGQPTFYEQLREFKKRAFENHPGNDGNISMTEFLRKASADPSFRRGRNTVSRSSSQRNRSSSVPRTKHLDTSLMSICALTSTASTTLTTVTSSSTATCSYTSSATQTPKSFSPKDGSSNLKRKRSSKIRMEIKEFSNPKRHSIADIPSAYERTEESSQSTKSYSPLKLKIHHVRDFSGGETLRGDSDVALAVKNKKQELKKLRKYDRWLNKVNNRLNDPIYECINSSCANNSKESEKMYMSMKDLRSALCRSCKDASFREDERELASYSSPRSRRNKRAPINITTDFHIYENENTFYVASDCENSFDTTSAENLNRKDVDFDRTCYFTSQPQQNIHKPVPIKGSNDNFPICNNLLTAENHDFSNIYANSAVHHNHPTEYENADVIYSHIRRAKSENLLKTKTKSESCIYKQTQIYTSTGQHLHTSSLSAINLPGLPLHHLRPPSLSPKSSPGYSSHKLKKKSKSTLKLDVNLPVIYEARSQEEEIYASQKKANSAQIKIENQSLKNDSEEMRLPGSSPSSNQSSSDNLDSGLSECINTPLVSPLSDPPSPNSDSLLGETDMQANFNLDTLSNVNENEDRTKENEYFFNDNYYKFINNTELYENKRESRNKSNKSEIYLTNKDNINENDKNSHYRQHNSLNLNNTRLSLEESLKSFLNGETNDVTMSQLLHKAVEKNLFSSENSYQDSSSLFKSSHLCNISRRHSFASIKDISTMSKNASKDDTSVWNFSSQSLRSPNVLKKSHSFISLTPAMKISPMNRTEKEVSVNSGTVNKILPTSFTREERSDPVYATLQDRIKTEPDTLSIGTIKAGRLGNVLDINPAHSPYSGRRLEFSKRDLENKSPGFHECTSSSFERDCETSPKSNELSFVYRSSPHSRFLPSHTSDLSSFPSRPGNSRLPPEMREKINEFKRHEDNSVPKLHPLSKHALETFQKINSSYVNVEEILGKKHEYQTNKQRKRQVESIYRLQRLLQEVPGAFHDDSVANGDSSADWSLEAVVDETSANECNNSTLSISSSSPNNTENSSPDNLDNYSICTLDSELAESVYIGSKLCAKIREISEEKMFERLRQSFRKKEKCVPKVGIFMFVDNPMYVSPDAKKDAKIVTFTPGKRKSFRFRNKKENKENGIDGTYKEKNNWFFSNPMYNSPSNTKINNKSTSSLYSTICEKENIKNSQLIRNNFYKSERLPLKNIWMQTNPCYNSPESKYNNNNNTCNCSRIQNVQPTKILQQNVQKPLPELPFYARKEKSIENHYLAPIITKKQIIPTNPKVEIENELKYAEHEYCTIAGDDSDSWVSQSSSSKKSDTPTAKRNLKFDNGKLDLPKIEDTRKETLNNNDRLTEDKSKEASNKSFKRKDYQSKLKNNITPSRIWRQQKDNAHSTPKKCFKDTMEKPSVDRGVKTPRSVKRDKMNKLYSKAPSPPELPPNPPPPLPPPVSVLQEYPKYYNIPQVQSRIPTGCLEIPMGCLDLPTRSSSESSKDFQLAPDRIYESISFIDDIHLREGPHPAPRRFLQSPCGKKPPPSAPNLQSVLNQRVHSSTSGVSSSSSKQEKNLKDISRQGYSTHKGKSRSNTKVANSPRQSPRGSTTPNKSKGRKTPRRNMSKKYKAKEVLQGKGQLKLAVYENFGLLTIHIVEARKLKPQSSASCNPYVKISLVPDNLERTFCRTALIKCSSSPFFDQKFSFDFLPEDLSKRLLISVWSRDTTKRRSEFLGCMSFSVSHILSKRVSGWFRLLTEAVGRRKHFAVSLINASLENSRNNIEVVTVENTSTIVPFKKEKHHHQIPNSMSLGPVIQGNPAAVVTTSKMAAPNGHSTQPVGSPLGQTPYTISVNIQRNSQGFGFSVSWTRPPRVEKVEKGKAAEQAGLKTGDYIIFVGQHNVVKMCENSILQLIRDCGDKLPLEVYRRGVSKEPKTLLNGWARPPSLTCEDIYGKTTLGVKYPISMNPFGTEVGGGVLI